MTGDPKREKSTMKMGRKTYFKKQICDIRLALVCDRGLYFANKKSK